MLASEWRGEEVPSSRKTTGVRSPSGGNHTASLNSRQVYASILDSQQAYGINGSKVRSTGYLGYPFQNQGVNSHAGNPKSPI